MAALRAPRRSMLRSTRPCRSVTPSPPSGCSGMPRTGATLSHGQITAVLRKTGRRDIEAETVLSRGTRLAHRARDGTRQHQWPGAHIIGIGIHIGIDQPMLCIQLMNMCIMSIICCDIVLTTVVDVSLDTSGTSVRAGSTPNGRPVRSMALCASVGADVHAPPHRSHRKQCLLLRVAWAAHVPAFDPAEPGWTRA